MKLNKAVYKSFLRHVAVAVSAVAVAVQTYESAGNRLGLNVETLVGVGLSLFVAGLVTAQRWADKTDPAFGKVAEVVLPEVEAKVTALVKKKVKATL